MRKIALSLSLPVLLLASVAWAQEVTERELYVEVEFEADQKWESRTEEFGYQHSTATTKQHWVLRTRLRSDSGLHTRNILDPSLQKRLDAKTIHLARQAKKDIEAAGGRLTIPKTPEGRSQLTLQMQEETAACGTDARCRQDTMMRYAAIFAVMDNPDVLENDDEEGQFLYYEPYPGCTDFSKVSMTLEIEGIRWSKSKEELVPFSEKRQADQENPPHDVDLCTRFLAVIDTEDADKPMYLENFYLPSGVGETAYTIYGNTTRKTEEQPMPPGVLRYVTERLKHAKTSGSETVEQRLTFPLNGRSEETGSSVGTARINLEWKFSDPEPVDTTQRQ